MTSSVYGEYTNKLNNDHQIYSTRRVPILQYEIIVYIYDKLMAW